jgi:hypothetical protein
MSYIFNLGKLGQQIPASTAFYAILIYKSNASRWARIFLSFYKQAHKIL